MTSHGAPLISRPRAPMPREAEAFPLQVIGHHTLHCVHSMHENNDWLDEAFPQRVFLNAVDAEPRGIRDGDIVLVRNARGAIELPCRVTNRLMPGVIDVRTVPSWDPPAITCTFAGAALLLGAPTAALLAIVAGWSGPLSAASFSPAVGAAVILEAWSATRLRRATGASRSGGGLRPRPAETLPAGPDPRGLVGGLALTALGLGAVAAGAGPAAAALLLGAILALGGAAAVSRSRFYLRAPGAHDPRSTSQIGGGGT